MATVKTIATAVFSRVCFTRPRVPFEFYSELYKYIYIYAMYDEIGPYVFNKIISISKHFFTKGC